MPCSFDCLSTYSCGSATLPIAGHSIAPFVRLTFGGEITVGNKSTPDGHACIKSFQYGVTNGTGVQVEIMDEAGGEFETALKELNKKLTEANEDLDMKIKFGWIKQYCDGSTEIEQNDQELIFLPITVKTSYEGGKIKFIIEGSDLMNRIQENRVEVMQGRDGQFKKLKQAIRDLFMENEPKVESVRFLKTDGSEWGFRKEDGGFEGPENRWTANQQNAMSTAREWITDFVTENNKGITIGWNNEKEGGEIIFWEADFKDDCAGNLGTYVVNGGKCSPVISFNPTASYTAGWKGGKGGNAAGALGAKTIKPEQLTEDSDEKVGTQTAPTAKENAVNIRPPGDVHEKTQEAIQAHEEAAILWETRQNVEAELKIQGDPKLASPVFLVMKTVSIVVINPIHINQGQTCGDWLLSSPCNPVWSSKYWRVQGVSHEISNGTFTTTLKVFLSPAESKDK